MRRTTFKNRMLITILAAVILYFAFYSKEHNATFKTIVRYYKPVDIWDFVADFNNMKKLNPSILRFNIVSDRSTHEHWQYSAHYEEYLMDLPFIHHNTYSHFEIKTEDPKYLITANHTTCFLRNMLCLPSTSSFQFIPLSDGTLCFEQLTYSCPWIFSLMCHRDVSHQHTLIMNNLQKEFELKPNQKNKVLFTS